MFLSFSLILVFSGACEGPKTGGEKVLIHSEDFLNQLNQTYRQQNKKKLDEIHYHIDSLPHIASLVHDRSQSLDHWIDSLRNRIIQVYSVNRLSRSWLHKNTNPEENPIHILHQKLLNFEAFTQEVAQSGEPAILQNLRFDSDMNPLWSDSLSHLEEFIRFNFSTPQRTLLIATLTGLSYQVLKWEHRYLQALENKSRARMLDEAANFQVKWVLDTTQRSDSLIARVFLSPPERLIQLSTQKHMLQSQELPLHKGWTAQAISKTKPEIHLEAGLCYRHRSNLSDSCWQSHKVYILDTLAQ